MSAPLLSVGPTGRYLVDTHGTPFQVRGNSPWLLCQLSNSDADQALTTFASQGFNSIIMESAIAPGVPYGAPQADGLVPFSDGVFTPVPAFWNKLDYKIDSAISLGLEVFLAFLYLGFGGSSSDGWFTYAEAAGATACHDYGAFLGNRYKNRTGLIWVAGGDYVPPDLTVPNALAAGILSQDTNHLFTGHTARNGQARAAFGSYITLGAVYTAYDTVSAGALTDYQSSPTQPQFLIEGNYEGNGTPFSSPVLTAEDVRVQAWQAFLQCIGGGMYGNHTVWPFDPGWQSALTSAGAQNMAVLNAFMQRIAWYKLAPDASNAMVTSGTRGTIGTTGYVAAARAGDRTLGVAYIPNGGSITITLSAFASRVRAWWVDPTTGSRTLISGSPFSNTGTHSFTTPGNNAAGDPDWALELQTFESPSPAFGFWIG